MVGALSIVRFRTAMKDPMDIAFILGDCLWHLQWCGFYNVSLVGTLIALIMLYGRVAMTSSQQF